MTAELIVALAIAGVAAGISAGLLGIGGGALMVPVLVLVAGYSQHEAEATSLLVILPTAVVGAVALHRKGVGNLRHGLVIGSVGTIGGLAGALLALALPAHALKGTFACFLAVIGVRMCWQSKHAPSGQQAKPGTPGPDADTEGAKR